MSRLGPRGGSRPLPTTGEVRTGRNPPNHIRNPLLCEELVEPQGPHIMVPKQGIDTPQCHAMFPNAKRRIAIPFQYST